MKTSKITFYKVGLNDSNWAYDSAAFTRILDAGRLGSELTLSQPLAFGQPFNISVFDYEKNYKTATYLKIVNTTTGTNVAAVTETRYGFINNMLELANGSFAVSYSLDDWANFILSGEYLGYNFDMEIERESLPLVLENNNYYALKTGLQRYTDDGIIKKVEKISDTPANANDITPLPAGIKCAVFFFSKNYFQGKESEYYFNGSYIYYNSLKERKKIVRINSSIGFMLFYASDYAYQQGVVGTPTESSSINNSIVATNLITDSAGTKKNLWNELDFYYSNINSPGIDKILIFDYIPYKSSGITVEFATKSQLWGDLYTLNIRGIEHADRLADIGAIKISDTNAKYFYSTAIVDFAPFTKVNFSDLELSDLKYAYENISNPENSLIETTPPLKRVEIRNGAAKIDIPLELVKASSGAYFGVSGDGETCFIKFFDIDGYTDEQTATAQNSNIENIAIKNDYLSYKNAKISGAIGITAQAGATGAALVSSIATGNVAGIVGTIGAAGQIFDRVNNQKMLSPIKQASIVNDQSMMFVTMQNNKEVITYTAPDIWLQAAKQDILHNGFAVAYMRDGLPPQMEAFNAIKCSYCEIHGLNQQAARRIADAFVAGVTLWTSSDVGNKDQRNIKEVSNV